MLGLGCTGYGGTLPLGGHVQPVSVDLGEGGGYGATGVAPRAG